MAPTVLTLAGLSRATDMPGRVLSEALDVGPEPLAVATYETGERVAAAPVTDAAVDPAIKERLKSLGYLGTETSPQGARNLAAMLQVSLVGYAVGGAFLGLAYFDLFYHLVALLAVTRAVVERHTGPTLSAAQLEPGEMFRHAAKSR